MYNNIQNNLMYNYISLRPGAPQCEGRPEVGNKVATPLDLEGMLEPPNFEKKTINS